MIKFYQSGGHSPRELRRGYRDIKRGHKSLARYQKQFAKDEAKQQRQADRQENRQERREDRQTRQGLRKELRQQRRDPQYAQRQQAQQQSQENFTQDLAENTERGIQNPLKPIIHRGTVGSTQQAVVKAGRQGDPYEYKMANGKYFTRKRGQGNWIQVDTNSSAGQAVMKAVENGRQRQVGGFGQAKPKVWDKNWTWTQEELDYQNRQAGGLMPKHHPKKMKKGGGVCPGCGNNKCSCGGKIKMANGGVVFKDVQQARKNQGRFKGRKLEFIGSQVRYR